VIEVIVPAVVRLGQGATFGCVTDLTRPFRWHWMKDGALIAGANSASSFTTHPLRAEDLGAKYSVRAWGWSAGAVVDEISEEVVLCAPKPAELVEAVEPEHAKLAELDIEAGEESAT